MSWMMKVPPVKGALEINESNEIDLGDLHIEARMLDYIITYLEMASSNQEPRISKPLLHFNSIYEITLPIYARFADSLSEDDLCGVLFTAHRL